ncbi:MAG: hypothetical protein MJZ64_01815 [Paludibacteraceae bacterium]|nr:hypothetical protein [Paludibacteraceae bacterium]
MRHFLEIGAKGLSAVFYPLWIPTYGMILFCGTVHQVIPLPFRYWLVSVGCTLLLTGLLPISLIFYQVRQGYIKDIYIINKEERTAAYIETAIGFAFWWYLLAFILKAPQWLSGIAISATLAIVLVAIINIYWKISAHLTGMGGLLGGIITYSFAYNTCSVPLVITVLLLSLAVMYARLYLNAHTNWQVIAGLALGMTCTILIPLLFYA